MNINNQNNRGLDLSTRYVHEFSVGDLTLQGQATWQFEDVLALFDGTGQDNNGRNGDPDLVANLDVLFESGDWSYFWRTQYIGRTSDVDILSPQISATQIADIVGEPIFYHSASIRREFERFNMTLGVANILDQEPPGITPLQAAGPQSSIGPSLLQSQYDYIGRRVFMRVSANF